MGPDLFTLLHAPTPQPVPLLSHLTLLGLHQPMRADEQEELRNPLLPCVGLGTGFFPDLEPVGSRETAQAIWGALQVALYNLGGGAVVRSGYELWNPHRPGLKS